MKKVKLSKNNKLFLLFPIGIVLTALGSHNPDLIEKVYSNGIYKFISQPISKLTGLFPFSLGELLFISTIFFIILKLFVFVKRFIENPNQRKKTFFRFLRNVLAFISVLYFIFITIWGMNYHRQPFWEIANLGNTKSSVKDLENLCESLIKDGNRLRLLIHEDPNGVMYLPKGHDDILNRAYKGYRKISTTYPQFNGSYGKPKKVFISELMSYMGISGIFSPFTIEANINTTISSSMFPVTVCHEMAHQYGFAREDEANFIAYLASKSNPDADFQYSGTLLAIIHSMNVLYEYDNDKYWELSETYSDGVKRDLLDISEHWDKYEGIISRTSSKVNDTYLKANYQEDGVASYGRMVDLLLAYYKRTEIITQ
ncbi:DUF3810 domain-containing protein [Sporosalibacterium faouarense]|uniref:DUF3810 domain-containing protein n=1 Tax=Sporosalibacterium faouarense TaxID=516123 RepID=UPI00192C0E40|nr:DUF3810 domain-containing protein [Sporosalibacterium faouarense]